VCWFLFWSTGLLLFHLFHPQPFLICTTGGKDLCGLLSGDAKQMIKVALFLLVAVAASSLVVFSHAAATAQFLAGRNWRRYPHGTPRQQHDESPRDVEVSLQPTFLGNVFAASGQRVWIVNGLHLHRCWQILITILPQADLTRLQAGLAELLLRAGSPVPVPVVDPPGGEATAFVPNEVYLEVRLTQMWLTKQRELWREYQPFGAVVTEFINDGRRIAIPAVLGSAELSRRLQVTGADDAIEFSKHPRGGPVPYDGDDVSLLLTLSG